VTGTAAVIGARGFIGSHLVAALRRAGASVAAYPRDAPCLAGRELEPRLAAAQIIFYLATTIVPATAHAEPARAASDRQAFDELMDAVEAAGRHPVVVLASSGGTVYDAAGPCPYHELAATRGRGEYGRAKLSLEQSLLWRAGALAPVVLRLANVYGPGQRARSGQGVIAYWLEAAAAGRPLEVYGDPATIRDFVYVGDVADAMVALYWLAGRPDPHAATAPVRVLNIGSGQPVTLGGLLGLVSETVGRPLAAAYRPPRPTDHGDIWLDVLRAARELGWHPRTPLDAGLRAAWRAREHESEISSRQVRTA
jgi:UDP-glucose 4-epimerase